MQNIGERLEEARKRKSLSIRDAAEATKIRGEYLNNFEANKFNIGLPEVFVRGFLRCYAALLGLPGDTIVADYKALGVHTDEKKPRHGAREVYGRMELPAQTAPSGKDTPDPRQAAAPTNPNATFRPTLPLNLPANPATLARVALAAAAALLLALLVIWGVRALTSSGNTPGVLWEHPADGEPAIGLLAETNAEVEVTDASGNLLYKGLLPAGELRPVPRRGNLTVACETPESIRVEIDGNRLQLKNPADGAFLKRATIAAPANPK
ncbi:MAG: helix-turn-helix domain-containing protein [Opitutaceae bacterium]|jgi:transcriptional regulator with XRE-family HTH domain|nr:helix-turn-helix domain-containing protein [Opitutaceae bacterium]